MALVALVAVRAGSRSDGEFGGGGGELAAILGPDCVGSRSKLVGVSGRVVGELGTYLLSQPAQEHTITQQQLGSEFGGEIWQEG